MKKLLMAVFLIPALGFAAEAVPADAPGSKVEATAPPQQTDATAPASATTTEGEKKDEEKKKEGTAATASKTTQPAAEQQTVNAALMTPEQLAAAGAWTFGLNLDNSVGSGTFANPELFALVVTSFSGSVTKPVRLFNRNFLVNGGLNTSYEFTRPDPLFGNVNGRRFNWSDGRIGAAMPGAIKEKITGISVNPAVSLTVPLTMESYRTGALSSLGASVRFIRQVGPVSVRVGVGGDYAINSSSYRVDRPVANVIRDGGPICRASDPVGSCGSAGLMSRGGVNGNVTALWFISDAIGAWGQIGAGSRWMNPAAPTRDEFTPPGTRVDGSPVAFEGAVPWNTTSSTFGLWYNLTDVFAVSGGIATFGPMRTMDSKAFRFPLIDVFTPEMNLTSYSVTLSATL